LLVWDLANPDPLLPIYLQLNLGIKMKIQTLPKQQTVNICLDRITVAGATNRAWKNLRASVALFLFRMLGVRALSVSLVLPAFGDSQDVEVSLMLGNLS
jgi:Mg2+/citrate symporter